MNIRNKLVITLLVTSLSGVAALGFFTFSKAEKYLLLSEKEKHLALASRQKKNIQDALLAWRNNLIIITHRVQFTEALLSYLNHPGEKERVVLKENLDGALDTIADIRRISICDLDNKTLITSSNTKTQYSTCQSDTVKANKKAHRTLWIDQKDSTLYFSLSEEIKIDNHSIGTIEIVVDADEILNIVNNYSGLGTTGETLLARRGEENKAIFITPLRYYDNSDQTFGVPADKFNVPITQALLKREIFMGSDEIVDYRGVPVIAASAYIPETDWGLVVKTDKNDAMAAVEQLKRTTIIFVFFIGAVVFVIAIFVSREISNPIVRLSVAAKKVREGDFSHREMVKTLDEVGYLTHTFNEMLDTLTNKNLELEKNEKRLKAIFDAAIDGIVTIDHHGIIQTINPAIEKIFGFHEDELIGENVKILMPEPYQGEHDTYIGNYLTTKNKKIIGIGREVQGKRKNGSEFPLELSVTDTNLKNQPMFVGTIRDIEKRKLAEQQLRDLEQRHDLALRGLSVGVWDWDVQTNELFWSKRFKEIVGVTDDTFIPHFDEFGDRLHPEDRNDTLQAVSSHLKNKTPYDVEYRLRHNDGYYVWIRAQGQALWNEAGEPIRMVGSVDDISDKKISQIELEESRTFLSLIMNSNPDLVFVKDDEFRIIEANTSFLNVYPEDMRDKILGTTTIENYEPEEADEFLVMDKKAFKDGYSEIVETIRFPDGRVRTLHTQKTRFYGRNKRPFILCIARDVTEREEMIEELKNTNAELEEFAYRTSHDLRSPLISSIRLIDIANNALNNNKLELANKSLTHAYSSLTKLENLVKDILDLTQVKKKEEEIREIDIEGVVDSALQKLSHMENFSRVDVSKSFDLTNSFYSKENQIILIVENLISNAIKYQNLEVNNPFIKINAYENSNSFVLEVKDNGLGIPKNQQDKLFSMFKRFHSRVSFGSGLGLYMIKKSVENLSGNIQFIDQDVGAVFKLTIPMRA